MKIGIIVGSIREGRKGVLVGRWVEAVARGHLDHDVALLDLKEFDVPLLTTSILPATAEKKYDSENTQSWSTAVDGCDAFVFVTPEYNHGVPGAFKNAVDSLGPEWTGKAVGFVSYGANDGVRAVEQWRQIVANFQMNDIRAQVALSVFFEFGEDGSFTPNERREGELKALLDQLAATDARGC